MKAFFLITVFGISSILTAMDAKQSKEDQSKDSKAQQEEFQKSKIIGASYFKVHGLTHCTRKKGICLQKFDHRMCPDHELYKVARSENPNLRILIVYFDAQNRQIESQETSGLEEQACIDFAKLRLDTNSKPKVTCMKLEQDNSKNNMQLLDGEELLTSYPLQSTAAVRIYSKEKKPGAMFVSFKQGYNLEDEDFKILSKHFDLSLLK